MLFGSSAAVSPVAGGSTNLGTIQLAGNNGAVTGIVTNALNQPVGWGSSHCHVRFDDDWRHYRCYGAISAGLATFIDMHTDGPADVTNEALLQPTNR